MFVYVLQPFVWKILKEVYCLRGADDNIAAPYMLSIFVCVFTLILSAAIVWFKDRSRVGDENINTDH